LSRIARLEEAHVLVTDPGLTTEARGVLAEHIDQLIVAPVHSSRPQQDGSPGPEVA
jgi:hypothetical protein